MIFIWRGVMKNWYRIISLSVLLTSGALQADACEKLAKIDAKSTLSVGEKIKREFFKAGCNIEGVGKKIYGQLQTNVDDLAKYFDQRRDLLVKLSQDTMKESTAQIRKELRDRLDTVKQAPARGKKIYVRESADPLSDQEKAFRAKRDPFVNAAQKKLGIKEPLSIAISGSGGGMRAMLAYLSHMLVLQEAGLLDSATYASALSGATWMLSSWLQQGHTLQQCRDFILDRVTSPDGKKDILMQPNEHTVPDIFDALVTKWAYGIPADPVDIYGGILGSYFMPQSHTQRNYLSGQRAQLATGMNPMPIYTAEWYRGKNMTKEIVEYNPYEVGIRKLGFIDSDGYGRHYKNGVSVDNAPPLSMGHGQGVWGSAFAAHAKFFWDHVFKSKVPLALKGVAEHIEHMLEMTKAGELQASKGAEVPNFTKGMSSSEVKNSDTLFFIDAGIDWMMNPVFSLYRDEGGTKAPNVVFVFDYSAGSLGEQELRKLVQYSQERQLKFPTIDFTDEQLMQQVQEKSMTIFQDKNDLDVPVVIYLPLVGVDMGHYHTFKFNYSRKEAKDLMSKAKNNLQENLPEIMQVIQQRSEAQAAARAAA